jgi:hypothetical protein
MSEARLAVYVAPPKIELKKRFLTVAAVETCGVLWDEKNVAWILPIRDPEDFSLWGWQEKGARGRFFRNQPQGVKKSKTVFNVQILKEDAPLIIVESPLDAVRLVGLGYNSISTYGAMPSVDQVKIMRRAPRVIAAFDNDSAGQKASEELRAVIKVIPAAGTTASNSEIKNLVVANMDAYFSIDKWDFGATFYFSELAAYIHKQIGDIVSSVVLVPLNPQKYFGDLYEIRSAPNQIFVNAATVNDIQVITALTSTNIRTAPGSGVI